MTSHLCSKSAVLSILGALMACSPDRVDQSPTPLPPPSISVSVHPADSGGTYPVALSLSDVRGTTRIGAFSATIHYDTTKVRYAGLRVADSLSVAVFGVDGQVRLAGAAAGGFPDGEWIWLTFAATSARDLAAAMTVEFRELTDLRGRELRPGVVTESTPRVAQ